jgi:hypothetical protein
MPVVSEQKVGRSFSGLGFQGFKLCFDEMESGQGKMVRCLIQGGFPFKARRARSMMVVFPSSLPYLT